MNNINAAARKAPAYFPAMLSIRLKARKIRPPQTVKTKIKKMISYSNPAIRHFPRGD
jgi:hypothetical protein